MTTTASPATVAAPRARRFRITGPLVGTVLVGIVVLFCLLYPLLPGYDAYTQNLDKMLLGPLTDPAHPLGTDALGRDEASRLALAGRITLGIVVAIVVVNALIGLVVGTSAGYLGGKVDTVLMGWADVQLALPVILVLIALSAALGPSVWLMIIVLAATYWVGYARVARGTALSLRERDFVIAPRIQGASRWWTARKHIMPNVAVQILILASTDIGGVMLLTSSFDFLGLGVQAPTPSWGLMISEGQKYIRQAPHLALVPGIAIFLVIIGTNLISQRFTAEGSALFRIAKKGKRA
ncbi:ABC transporter permease [Mycetocola lacteus]|uniref:ABC transporter permease n=1 Tax=Mycetocola lacteus TaxID=76637 RepID=A0A3L7AU73_9MICO|nr:ABC transporter permease [Mycetocola lacteus]RLP83704.1 ABC transporter permease [Mycetocola lacteus]